MNNKKILIYSVILTFGILFLNSCIKEKWEVPAKIDYNVNFADSIAPRYEIVSIHFLKNEVLVGDKTLIEKNYVIEGTVVSNDEDGNIYKELYIQDSSLVNDVWVRSGIVIQINLTNLFIDYPFGQKVAVKCKDLYIGDDEGVIKLGSLFEDVTATGETLWSFGRIQGQLTVDKHIFKMQGGKPISPKVVTIKPGNINSLSTDDIATLVKINDVQFYSGSLGMTFADPDNLLSLGHYIEDMEGNQILTYNSAYATFAGDSIPEGKGSVTALYGVYVDTKQLYFNKAEDIQLNNPRYVYYKKDFEDENIYSGGWITKMVTGTLNWTIGTVSRKYIQMTNWTGSSNLASETWFISPPINVDQLVEKKLSFETACNYSGPALEIKISDNYDGVSAPSTATWNTVTATLSSGSWAWVSSGDINLATAYSGKTIRLAFKYTGTTSSGKTWEIDNIIIK